MEYIDKLRIRKTHSPFVWLLYFSIHYVKIQYFIKAFKKLKFRLLKNLIILLRILLFKGNIVMDNNDKMIRALVEHWKKTNDLVVAFEDFDGQMHRHMIHLPNEDVDKILNTGIMVTVQFIMLKAERAMQGKLLLILTERKCVKPPMAKQNAL